MSGYPHSVPQTYSAYSLMGLTTRHILDLNYQLHKNLALAGLPALVTLTLDAFVTLDPRNIPQPLRLIICNIPVVKSLADLEKNSFFELGSERGGNDVLRMWAPSGNDLRVHDIQLVDGSISLRCSQLFRTRIDNSTTVPLDLTYAKEPSSFFRRSPLCTLAFKPPPR
ncbi:hypothetical protein JCM3765_007543 [Sporobolomyces pararoseus]